MPGGLTEYDGFIGPSNKTSSRAVSGEQLTDWYTERISDGTPKATWTCQPTPGLSPFVGLGAGPVRALFTQNGRTFGVGGGLYVELLPNQTVIVRGTVPIDAHPACISSNGTAGFQNLITSGGLGFIHNLKTNAFAQISDPSFPANVVQSVFFNGWFIVLDALGTFTLSTLEDGTDWSNADFGQVSTFSDTVVSMLVTQDRLCFFGTQNTQLWYASGSSDFPLNPIPSAVPEHGILAPFSAVEINNTPYWLGQDAFGANVVWYLNGLTPTVASSLAVSDSLAQIAASSVAQAVAWGYQSRGHLFYVLQVPGLAPTWVYDLSTQQWHRRGIFDPLLMEWVAHPGRCHTWAFGFHLIGDRRSGTVYLMDDRLTTYTLAAP